MPFRDPSAESFASLIVFTVSKISVNKKFGYENFGSFKLPDKFIVRNFLFLMEVLTWEKNIPEDQNWISWA